VNTTRERDIVVVKRVLPIRWRPSKDAQSLRIRMRIPRKKLIPPYGDHVLDKAMWSTPLSGNWFVSRIGSVRAGQHLPNQIMYEEKTASYRRTRRCTDVDQWVVNPEFVEWLMGYPKGWTLAASLRSHQ